MGETAARQTARGVWLGHKELEEVADGTRGDPGVRINGRFIPVKLISSKLEESKDPELRR